MRPCEINSNNTYNKNNKTNCGKYLFHGAYSSIFRRLKHVFCARGIIISRYGKCHCCPLTQTKIGRYSSIPQCSCESHHPDFFPKIFCLKNSQRKRSVDQSCAAKDVGTAKKYFD